MLKYIRLTMITLLTVMYCNMAIYNVISNTLVMKLDNRDVDFEFSSNCCIGLRVVHHREQYSIKDSYYTPETTMYYTIVLVIEHEQMITRYIIPVCLFLLLPGGTRSRVFEENSSFFFLLFQLFESDTTGGEAITI